MEKPLRADQPKSPASKPQLFDQPKQIQEPESMYDEIFGDTIEIAENIREYALGFSTLGQLNIGDFVSEAERE